MRWLVALAFVLTACATTEFRPLVGSYHDAANGAAYTFLEAGTGTVRYSEPVITPTIRWEALSHGEYLVHFRTANLDGGYDDSWSIVRRSDHGLTFERQGRIFSLEPVE